VSGVMVDLPSSSFASTHYLLFIHSMHVIPLSFYFLYIHTAVFASPNKGYQNPSSIDVYLLSTHRYNTDF
jgi:hypothetical protein